MSATRAPTSRGRAGASLSHLQGERGTAGERGGPANTALLDVNVLVALFDPAHVHHEAAHDWFERQHETGWATCPLTENGFLRVVTGISYPGRRTTLADALARLAEFRGRGRHEFWADSVSLSEAGSIDPRHVAGAGQLTDVYLLLLATARGGTLATFDRRIALDAVPGAVANNLTIVGA